MFRHLPAELNLSIYSIMSTRDIIASLLVNKDSQSFATIELEKRKKQAKEFSIGRIRLKELCLEHPQFAMIGLEADANRGRWLLLVNGV